MRVEASSDLHVNGALAIVNPAYLAVSGTLGIDVARAATVAEIGAGSRVSAARDVTVRASGASAIDSFAFSASVPVLGVRGVMTVAAIGDPVAPDDRRSGLLQNPDTVSTQTAQARAATRIDLEPYWLKDAPGAPARDDLDFMTLANGGSAGARAAVAGRAPGLEAADAARPETRASVGSAAVVTAGGSLAVLAEESAATRVTSGQTALVAVANVGGSVAVGSVATYASATVGAGARLAAGSDLTVAARSVIGRPGWDVAAFAGSGITGISANGLLSVLAVRHGARTEIGAGASLDAGRDLALTAEGVSDARARAVMASGLNGVNLSLVGAYADESGVIATRVGDGARLGSAATRAVTATAERRGRIAATSEMVSGLDLGRVSVVNAVASTSIDVLTQIGSARMRGDSIAVRAALSLCAAGPCWWDGDPGVLATTTGAGGTISSVDGALSIARASGSARVRIGADADIAGLDVDVAARATGKGEASSNGVGVGLSLVSGTVSEGQLGGDVSLSVGNGASIVATREARLAVDARHGVSATVGSTAVGLAAVGLVSATVGSSLTTGLSVGSDVEIRAGSGVTLSMREAEQLRATTHRLSVSALETQIGRAIVRSQRSGGWLRIGDGSRIETGGILEIRSDRAGTYVSSSNINMAALGAAVLLDTRVEVNTLRDAGGGLLGFGAQLNSNAGAGYGVAIGDRATLRGSRVSLLVGIEAQAATATAGASITAGAANVTALGVSYLAMAPTIDLGRGSLIEARDVQIQFGMAAQVITGVGIRSVTALSTVNQLSQASLINNTLLRGGAPDDVTRIRTSYFSYNRETPIVAATLNSSTGCFLTIFCFGSSGNGPSEEARLAFNASRNDSLFDNYNRLNKETQVVYVAPEAFRSLTVRENGAVDAQGFAAGDVTVGANQIDVSIAPAASGGDWRTRALDDRGALERFFGLGDPLGSPQNVTGESGFARVSLVNRSARALAITAGDAAAGIPSLQALSSGAILLNGLLDAGSGDVFLRSDGDIRLRQGAAPASIRGGTVDVAAGGRILVVDGQDAPVDGGRARFGANALSVVAGQGDLTVAAEGRSGGRIDRLSAFGAVDLAVLGAQDAASFSIGAVSALGAVAIAGRATLDGRILVGALPVDIQIDGSGVLPPGVSRIDGRNALLVELPGGAQADLGGELRAGSRARLSLASSPGRVTVRNTTATAIELEAGANMRSRVTVGAWSARVRALRWPAARHWPSTGPTPPWRRA